MILSNFGFVRVGMGIKIKNEKNGRWKKVNTTMSVIDLNPSISKKVDVQSKNSHALKVQRAP